MNRCRRGSPETERLFMPKSEKVAEVLRTYMFTDVYYTSGVLTIFPRDHIRAPYTLISCWVSI